MKIKQILLSLIYFLSIYQPYAYTAYESSKPIEFSTFLRKLENLQNYPDILQKVFGERDTKKIIADYNLKDGEISVSKENLEMLKQYPNLLNEIFETNNPIKLEDSQYIFSKFKKLIMESKSYGKIIMASILTSILYGIIHDQITARICLEYFSQGFHKEMLNSWANKPILDTLRQFLLNSSSPTTYALIWGTIATWWVGMPLGIILSFASRFGSWPKLELRDLKKPLIITAAGVAAASILSGLYAHVKKKAKFERQISLFKERGFDINKPFDIDKNIALYMDIEEIPGYSVNITGVPINKLHKFTINLFAHDAAYTAGAIFGLGLILYSVYRRYQLSKSEKYSQALILAKILKSELDRLKIEASRL